MTKVQLYWKRMEEIYMESDFENPEDFLEYQGIKISNKTRKCIKKWKKIVK